MVSNYLSKKIFVIVNLDKSMMLRGPMEFAELSKKMALSEKDSLLMEELVAG